MINLFTIIGLTLDVLGVIGLYKYGLPSDVIKPDPNSGDRFVAEGKPSDYDERLKEYNDYKCKSQISLTFILIGFLLQGVQPLISFLKCL